VVQEVRGGITEIRLEPKPKALTAHDVHEAVRSRALTRPIVVVVDGVEHDLVSISVPPVTNAGDWTPGEALRFEAVAR